MALGLQDLSTWWVPRPPLQQSEHETQLKNNIFRLRAEKDNSVWVWYEMTWRIMKIYEIKISSWNLKHGKQFTACPCSMPPLAATLEFDENVSAGWMAPVVKRCETHAAAQFQLQKHRESLCCVPLCASWSPYSNRLFSRTSGRIPWQWGALQKAVPSCTGVPLSIAHLNWIHHPRHPTYRTLFRIACRAWSTSNFFNAVQLTRCN